MNLILRLRRAFAAFREPESSGLVVDFLPTDIDALAREAVARQRQRVEKQGLGTPEDMGFDTPTEEGE